jgi:hypothetical protein
MRSIWQVFGRSLAVLVLAGLVSGCAANSGTSTHPGTSATGPSPTASATPIMDRAGPPPITLKDTSPGQLSLVMSLEIGGYDAQSRDMTGMDVVFMHQGRVVQFVAGEHLSCNGLAVPGYGSNFYLKVPSETFSGKLITCTYASGKTSATFTFTCPLSPTILSPQDNTQVTRSSRTSVSYRISPDWAYYVIALSPPQKVWTPEAPAQPNPVMLDTSAFSPGPGSIAIHQFFTVHDLRGPAFQSVQEQGSVAVYEIEVTWV